MKKSLIAFLLLMASGAPVSAGSCCAPCGPLTPCELTASIRGGVEWMYYPDRKRNDYVNCVSGLIIVDELGEEIDGDLFLDEQVDTGTTPKFTDQFNLPWTIVGEIGYALSCNTEVFADFHYGRATGKSRSYVKEFDALTFPSEFLPTEENVVEYKPAELWNFTEDYSDLKYFGGTIGIRHYFEPICNRAYPFFGVKAGVRHFDPVRAVITGVVSNDGGESSNTQVDEGIYYDSYNHVHGGFQMGLSMKCGDCFSAFIMVEALGTCGFKPHESGFQFTNNGFTEDDEEEVDTDTAFLSVLKVPARRTFNILSFPVTAGVQYHF